MRKCSDDLVHEVRRISGLFEISMSSAYVIPCNESACADKWNPNSFTTIFAGTFLIGKGRRFCGST
jgi:hypothetical protein